MFCARLHSNGLRQALAFAQQHQSSWNQRFPLSQKALDELEWWQHSLTDHAATRLLDCRLPQMWSVPGMTSSRESFHVTEALKEALQRCVLMDTDASPYGWGAVIHHPLPSESTGGWLSPEEQQEHQNVREMLAV